MKGMPQASAWLMPSTRIRSVSKGSRYGALSLAATIEIGQPASPMISRVIPLSVASPPDTTSTIIATKSTMLRAARSKPIRLVLEGGCQLHVTPPMISINSASVEG